MSNWFWWSVRAFLESGGAHLSVACMFIDDVSAFRARKCESWRRQAVSQGRQAVRFFVREIFNSLRWILINVSLRG